MELAIQKFYRGRHTIDEAAVKTVLDCVKDHMEDFERIKFIANEDSSSQLGGIDSDHISGFFEQFVHNFEEGERLSASELQLEHIDQKYLGIFLAHFHRKSKFIKHAPDKAFLAKFSKATAAKL